MPSFMPGQMCLDFEALSTNVADVWSVIRMNVVFVDPQIFPVYKIT